MNNLSFLNLWQACDYIKEVINLLADYSGRHFHGRLPPPCPPTPSAKADSSAFSSDPHLRLDAFAYTSYSLVNF